MATNRKLGRTTDIRMAMLKTLTTDLIMYGKIETTLARAKEVKSIADSIIALAIKEKDNILLSIDDEEDHKANLEIFALDDDLLENYEGEGYYDDETDTLSQIVEYAIPSNEIKRSDLIDTIPLTDERVNSHSYDSVTEAYRRVDNLYREFYDGEEDGYELS